jgi:hypothetical protein
MRWIISLIIFCIFSQSLIIKVFAETDLYTGRFSNADLNISWEVGTNFKNRMKVTGLFRNNRLGDIQQLELVVRVLERKGKLAGSAKFEFLPVIVKSENELPFGMMVDLLEDIKVDAVEFNLYFGILDNNQSILPQFVNFIADVSNPVITSEGQIVK